MRRGLWEALFILLLVASSPAPLLGIESDDVASLAEGTMGKGFREDGWNRDAPVDIQSEEMTVDFEEHRIVFRGNVNVRQSDFSLSAEEVTAVFGRSADDIEKIVAVGDVMIQKANKKAWGEEASYTRENATIRLTGDPVLKQGRNFIKGKEILVRLDEDRMEVKGRVKAEFILSEEDRDQGSRDRDQGHTPPSEEPGSGVGDQNPSAPPDVELGLTPGE